MGILKIFLGMTVLGLCCGGIGTAHAQPLQPEPEGFTPDQRQLADEIVSIFENDTPHPQYGYIENLHDGRGFTAGREGFTTATGDLAKVVESYCSAVPENKLSPYLPVLQDKARKVDDSMAGLDGFEHAWATCANDPALCRAQDEVVNQLVYLPSVNRWRAEGCKSPLALLFIYDTEVEQGDALDPDGTPAVLKKTDELAGGSPGQGVPEAKWLEEFLRVRRGVLLNPSNAKTKEAWSESVTRCDALEDILDDEDMNLAPPVTITPFGERWAVTMDGAFRVDIG